MKKLPKDHLIRQDRIVADRVKRDLLSKEKRKKARQSHSGRDQNSVSEIPGRERCLVPKDLSLFAETADETVEFIKTIRTICAASNVLIDFSKTEYLSAAGAVYLYSEIDRIQNEYGSTKVRIDRRTIQDYRDILREFGLLKLANGDAGPTGKMLPILAGEGNEYIEEIIDYLFAKAHWERQLNNVTIAEAEQLASSAVMEAMLNVGYHAYPDQPGKRWWFTATIIEEQLHIAICDRGVGIPKTLPKKGLERLSMVAGNDSQMIQAAMQYTRTSRIKGGAGLWNQGYTTPYTETKAGVFDNYQRKGALSTIL